MIAFAGFFGSVLAGAGSAFFAAGAKGKIRLTSLHFSPSLFHPEKKSTADLPFLQKARSRHHRHQTILQIVFKDSQ